MTLDLPLLGYIAWGMVAIFPLAGFAGGLLIERSYRPAIVVFAVATLCGFAFSFLSGFSIGRFTALLPLILTAFAVTRDRAPRLQLAAYIGAVAVYLLLAWVFAEQIRYWGIQFELPLCLVAYAIAFVFPPARAR